MALEKGSGPCHPPTVSTPSEEPPQGDAGSAQEALQGLVERVTYHREDSLYTVLRVLPEAGFTPRGATGSLFAPTRVTAVGRMVEPVEGQRVRLLGRWTRHATHGDQYEFEQVQLLDPGDEAGLVRYLASKAFEGVGETLAQRIVERLGVGALEVIRDHPEALDQVTGLRPEVKERLIESVRSRHAQHRSASFLMGLGLGPTQAQTVLASLGPETEALLEADPYTLTRVRGMGFRTADRVAHAMGLEANDERRLVAALEHCLAKASDEGHTLMRQGDLLQAALDLLEGAADRDALRTALGRLEREDRAVVDRSLLPEADPEHDEHPVYLPWLLASERGLARNLARLLGVGRVEALADEARLQRAAAASGIELHEDQRAAVLGLLSSPVALLTGGPGVGKTTIVRLIADLAQAAGYEVLLASPTGRAAKRLSEATGRPASTIHRLLKFQPPDGFQHTDTNPLEGGLVLVDEISMLDVALAHHLVKAVAAPTRLVLVGDPDQLPSVGAGSVLSDLLRSGEIPTWRLTRVFRQDRESLIVENAHRVLAGDLPRQPERSETGGDFFLFPVDDPARAADRLVEVVTERIPKRFGMDWTEEVQVISPMYKGDCGVDALNDRLREAAGYGGREVERGGQRWRVGDRVIQTRNDYDKEVFNGDMGRISAVSPDGVVTVQYPEQKVLYTGGELSDLRPAFAITVHRSQGGEFPCVVIPLTTPHRVMLQRNLLYTAITRAKRLVVLVGSETALRWAVETADQALRMSLLSERLVLARADA